MASSGDISVRTLQQLDRLVSASSPSDALESIQVLTASLHDIFKSDEEDKEEKILAFLSACYENADFMASLCSLLSDGTMRSASSNGSSMIVDDGDSAACSFLSAVLESLDLKPKDQTEKKHGRNHIKSFYQERQNHLKKMLSSPNDGAIVHALVDLLSPGHHDSISDSGISLSRRNNLYAQTQALKIVSSLISILPTLIHSQILSAPDGLNRILDLLHNSSTEESIRNEAILLCTSMAKTNAGCARLMIFGEAYEKVLQIAESEISHDNQATGVSSASVQVIVDCFNLAIELTKQDEMGSEVFLGSKSLVTILIKFLDLRTGEKFVYPEILGASSGSHEDEVDDLDDILNNGKKVKTADDIEQRPAKIPYLTIYESTAVLAALELLRVLIVGDESILTGNSDDDDMIVLYEKKRSRQQSILSYDILSRLVIDMALYTLPPPDSPSSVYVSAVPLHEDQLKALDVFAALSLDCGDELQHTILNKEGIYLHAGVLDRLMYLVCTGDGANRPAKDADEISMYSLGVLRCLLSAKEASIMVMHTLAPPIDDQGPDAPPPVFQKLVNTLAENLYCLIDPNVAKDLDNNEIYRINRMIIGSAGALGIFLTNGAGDTTREMLLRVPVPPPPKADENSSVESHRTPMIDCMLAYFEQSLQDSRVLQKSSEVLSALLRLFVEWIPSAPNVISAIFSASSSISFSALLQKKVEKGKPPIIQSLSALFWGLCLEYMNPENEIGGWTSASIVNMISNGMGIRKFTQILESLKMPLLSDDGAAVPPWTCSPAERSHLMKWYTENVNIVRKRTVQELTFVANNHDDSDNEDTDQLHKAFPLKDKKNIYKLVSEQNSEIESLRMKLADSENMQKLQSSKLKIFQKRLEANPSQLDDMLNELTTKISDLESQNRNLKNVSISLEMQHEKELKCKAEEILLIQENIKSLELEKKVILEEHLSTRKELEGLSSAYTNLEEEYNNISKNGSIKEEVIAVSSYRKVEEENLKLKHDVHAANEWMRKAVLKMDELKRRNQSLESELNVSKSAYTQYANEIGSEIESLRSQLASQSGRMEIISTERDSLAHQMEELKAKLTAAEIEINEKGDTVDSAVISELNEKIIGLEMKLEKQETTFEDTLRELRSSLIAKDGRLIELEQKLEHAQELVIASEMDESRNSEILNLEYDVKKLTEANKAAQQWMANAVKHHNSLKNQLEDAKRKIDVLEKEQCIETNLPKLQEELHLITAERNHALERIGELEPLKEEIEILRNEHQVQLREWKDEKESLEAALSEKNELISDLESKTLQSAVSVSSSSTREESESFSLQLADVQRLRDENEILISERVDHLAAIDDMKIRLTEFQSWTETAQHRINDLEAEKEIIERELMEIRLKKSADEDQDVDAHEDLVASNKGTGTNENIGLSQQFLTNSNTNDLEEKDGSKSSQQTDSVNDVHPILNNGMSPNDKVSELEAELSRLQIHMEEKDDQINKMHKDLEESQRTRDDFHHSEMVVLRDKLQLLENKYQETLEVNASLENKSSDLIREASRIHEVEAMLAKKETEVSELCLQVEDARNSISKLKDEYENTSKHSQNTIKDLELEICNLHATIQNQEDETVTAISQWETRCQELEEEIEKLKTENNSNQDALAAISEWESRCSELEDEINRLISEQNLSRKEELEQEIEELKSTITLLQEEANGAISKWEERSTEMEKEIQRLTLECSEVESLRQQLTSANEVLVSDKALLKELMINVDVERENVSTVQKEKDDAEIIYKSHIEDLERAIASHEQENLFLQSQIDDRDDLVERVNQQVLDLTKEVDDIRTQSEEVVREWQENSNQQEETISDLRRTIESQNEQAVVAIQQWESRCDALHQKIEELELELEDYETNQAIGTLKHQLDIRTEELCKLKLAFDNIVIKEKKLTEDLQISQQSCANLQSIRDERDNLLSGKRSMEDEIERLHSAISELEQTHQDQNKLIQEMKDAQATNERALKEERENNKILKEEFKKLRDDFALVLGHNEQDPFGFHVEKVTSSAAINIMEKERKEINSLRKSLRNLQEELNSSHQKDREVEIKLSDSLQLLTSYEKEICSAKSDIEILQLTLESENRDHLEQRSELEERIRHLEEDRHQLNSSYIASIENLRNDLSSVKAERDRLTYALEESERMNSTWVYNTSISPETVPTNHIEAELSKCSSEKSKLLMTLSKQSSSVEKRIRSALSGDFPGDDVRKSEFTSLQDQIEKVNIEYEKAKSRNNELLSLVQDANKLKYENERLEQEVDDLLQEKSRIESAFTQKLSSSQDKLAELENRYKELQTNFKELQRVQKFKGSLSADVEKDDIAVSDMDQQAYIDGLNAELKQSKSLYQDLWMEHEDLLALLAQQDCEKRCLEEALVKSEGHEALDRVMASVQCKLQNELGIS